MIKLVILLLVVFVSFVKSDVAVCSTTNTFNTFNISDYMRFQSPNYPATMVNSSSLNCSSLFVSNNNNLWLAFINGAIDEALIDDNVTVSAQTIDFESNYDVRTYVSATGMMRFQFLNQVQITQPWIAFDAVVLPFSPSLSSGCPFSGQTITLDNETIIPIASDYGIFANPRNDCFWTFKIDDPSSYQFKIYIKKLTNNWKLTMKNDTTTNGMGFNITVANPQVMYLMGSELNIMFTNVSNELNEFFAIISAVPISANRVEGCTYKPMSNGRTIISNIDYINGYNEFTTCTYNISIQSGYEAIFEVMEFWVEAGVDKLTLSKDTQVYEMKNAEFFKIKSDLDGSMFKFVADGNIRQAGFSAAFTPIKCECAPSAFVIPCNESASLTPLPNGSSAYCDNQDCNYTISLDSSCTMDYYTISPLADLRNTSWLAIYVNGSVFQNFTEYGSPEHIPYPRNTNLTIVFHSGKSVSPFVIGTPRWSIGTTAIAAPKTTKIMLNSTSQPTFAIWLDDMPADEAITVCSPDNDLELFIANGFSLSTFNLYDSDGLTNFVSTLSSDKFTQTSPDSSISVITSKSGCFTIYCAQKIGYYMSTALFRMKNTHIKNCNIQQNVVRLLQNVPATFTVNATNGGSCEMIVFASQYNVNPFVSLDDFQTSSSSNAIFSFSSGLNGKPYFDMPSSETDLWKQTAIYTPALSVVAPASSSLTFNISTGLTSIDEGSAKRKGILVSQLYSGNNLTIFLSERMYSFNLNSTRSANFVVKDLSPSATVMLLNTATNENHTFTANENYSTNGSGFRISTVQNGNNAFRIEYGFDVLVNDATTQPPATTTDNNGFMPSLHFTALFVSIISVLFCF